MEAAPAAEAAAEVGILARPYAPVFGWGMPLATGLHGMLRGYTSWEYRIRTGLEGRGEREAGGGSEEGDGRQGRKRRGEEDLKDLVAHRGPRKGPFMHIPRAPEVPPPGVEASSSDKPPGDVGPGAGPAPNQVHVEADYGMGRYDPSQLEHQMPSLGNPAIDAVRFEVWKVAPSVLLELDGLGVDNAVANIAGHSDQGARFIRELFMIFQRENDVDLRTYRNPSAAITSAVRKEMDRMRPEIAVLPGQSGRSDRPDGPHRPVQPRPTYDDYDVRRQEHRGGYWEDRRGDLDCILFGFLVLLLPLHSSCVSRSIGRWSSSSRSPGRSP
ncbi:hypothetical protein AK812_SmicGene2191 [Symbiodinium microadriaticum]|uniref:Uncharacterized protein n=1 Tax=Symbiodinium microadriaticum TaxID=2951 RepID=A0A1Q9F244_SYMMI|nr:hypothetical protein AK812_SmicGene2191 [Symbiodinium microadriaticum]